MERKKLDISLIIYQETEEEGLCGDKRRWRCLIHQSV
jgi:hypothetical protein